MGKTTGIQYSLYFLLLPFTFSAGYFLAFSPIFRRAAVGRSTLHRSVGLASPLIPTGQPHEVNQDIAKLLTQMNPFLLRQLRHARLHLAFPLHDFAHLTYLAHL